MAKKKGNKKKNNSEAAKEARKSTRTVRRYIKGGRNTFNQFPEFSAPLERLSTDTPEELGNLNTLAQDAYDKSGRTGEMSEALNFIKSGVGGLTGQEYQGFREQAQGEINRNADAQRRSTLQQQARGNVRGANAQALMNSIGRGQGEQVSDLEQQLMLKNVDVQDRRRSEYANQLRGAEGQEADIRNSLFQNLQGAGRDITNYRDQREADNVNTGLNERRLMLDSILGFANLASQDSASRRAADTGKSIAETQASSYLMASRPQTGGGSTAEPSSTGTTQTPNGTGGTTSNPDGGLVLKSTLPALPGGKAPGQMGANTGVAGGNYGQAPAAVPTPMPQSGVIPPRPRVPMANKKAKPGLQQNRRGR